MKQEELNKILAEHKLWLENEGGNRADLSGSNLRNSVLRNSDLRNSDLSGSDLSGSVLSGSDLRDSDLIDSDLIGSDLRDSDLRCSDLRNSDLSDSVLRNSDLSDSDLRGSDLRGCDLYGANLVYSCWPLWCGSLDAHIDTRIAVQLLYHLMRPCLVSPEVDGEFKRALFAPELIKWANRFHLIDSCGESKYDAVGQENGKV